MSSNLFEAALLEENLAQFSSLSLNEVREQFHDFLGTNPSIDGLRQASEHLRRIEDKKTAARSTSEDNLNLPLIPRRSLILLIFLAASLYARTRDPMMVVSFVVSAVLMTSIVRRLFKLLAEEGAGSVSVISRNAPPVGIGYAPSLKDVCGYGADLIEAHLEKIHHPLPGRE